MLFGQSKHLLFCMHAWSTTGWKCKNFFTNIIRFNVIEIHFGESHDMGLIMLLPFYQHGNALWNMVNILRCNSNIRHRLS